MHRLVERFPHGGCSNSIFAVTSFVAMQLKKCRGIPGKKNKKILVSPLKKYLDLVRNFKMQTFPERESADSPLIKKVSPTGFHASPHD